MKHNELKAKILFFLTSSGFQNMKSTVALTRSIFTENSMDQYQMVVSAVDDLVASGWVQFQNPGSPFVKINTERLALLLRDEMDP